MKALKDNKEYTIAEEQKHAYLEEGYDIYGEDGKLLEYSPRRKSHTVNMLLWKRKSTVKEMNQGV